MGDSESRRNARAVAEALRKARQHRHDRLDDVRLFEMDIRAGPIEFRRVIDERREYLRTCASCEVEGVPVTTPETDNDIHHRVRLNDSDAAKGGQPDDIVAVELLFRNYDIYYTAVRLITRAHVKEDPSGWYYFKDAVLPWFLIRDLRRKVKAYKLPFTTTHKNPENISVGCDSLKSVFKHYSRYTPSNYREKTEDREEAGLVTMIFFGEGQRYPEIADELIRLMILALMALLPRRLCLPINQWSVISVMVFEHLLGVPGRLEALEAKYGWVLHVGNEYRLSLLVGPAAKIAVLKYHNVHTRNLIKLRQSGQRRR